MVGMWLVICYDGLSHDGRVVSNNILWWPVTWWVWLVIIYYGGLSHGGHVSSNNILWWPVT
jgi:hypothetical protein